jgi:hypothetical protein
VGEPDQLWPEPEREREHPHADPAGHQEMAQLVDEDQDAEDEQEGQKSCH